MVEKIVSNKSNLDILFEDNHLIVLNKPAGIAVHGGSGVDYGVIEALRSLRPQQKFLELFSFYLLLLALDQLAIFGIGL